ncbi:hypothetical protein EYF80_020692 [Liparis tanakae]|uniref:Uncharacterized protein n=1 Tax=Liparis tanakae TaxID=230148 RepID=A0A4Z2HTH3_9TELE|nr:hypothetical protein EYF80_020692 [Liparis tanakae]
MVLQRPVQHTLPAHTRQLETRGQADAAAATAVAAVAALRSTRVDARVHDGVEYSQEQQQAFGFLDVTAGTVEAVQEQNHQARSPADHKGPFKKNHSVAGVTFAAPCFTFHSKVTMTTITRNTTRLDTDQKIR